MKEIELLDKRGKKEKHFLQENGTIIAKMYSDDIHFIKDGKYEEIDNTLIKQNNYYINKNNSYKTYFKENSAGTLMKFEIDNHYLSIELVDGNRVPINLTETSSKFVSKIKYENVFENIDLEYKILSTKIKESFILKDRGNIGELSFVLKTDLDLELGNKNIVVLKNNQILFTLDGPYMIDANNKTNNNINYKLTKMKDYYKLDLVLDAEWLKDSNTLYPVIIDPTISTDTKNNVYDTYIYPWDTNVDRNSQDILKAGVEKVNGNDVINRTLLKFELPTIGTGSQIYEANINLVDYTLMPRTDSIKLVDVHRLTTDFTETGANWSNMNDKYDARIEAAFWCSRSYEEYTWEGNVITTHIIPSYSRGNITSLVKKWYTGTPNNGIMIKSHKEVYDQNMLPAFYSKNNTITGDSPHPRLQIVYRNQNGLESYMNYQSQSFNNGTVYENTYNGNLIAAFGLGSTIGGKMPANLSLYYNTNDVVLNNDNGIGIGYKFNLWQTIKPETIGTTNYLQYFDEDGTLHYFYEENGIYQDEDNLNMEIEVNSDYYILKDKYGNNMKFSKRNNIGYLSEIKDIKGNFITINYNSNNLIGEIIDANNQKINITYETDKISIISPDKTVTLNYTNGKINSILNLEGYTYFTYNESNLINKITDIDGTSMNYEYYEQKPYKIKKVTEYGINNQNGAYFTIEYGNKSTTIIDNKNRATVISFNEEGNPVCTSNLKDKNNISNAYGTVHRYGEYDEYKNKLISNKIPVKYVNNLLKNISFETDNIYFQPTDGVELSISEECANSGLKSLKMVRTEAEKEVIQNVSVKKGNYYTFSAFIKNNNSVRIGLSYLDADNKIVEEKGKWVPINDGFNRTDVTIYYPLDSVSDLSLKIYFTSSGTSYMDDIQLEQGEVVNHFNYLENSDFKNGLGDWEYGSSDNDSTRHEVVTLEDGNKALKIKMDPEYDTYMSKEFNIGGEKDDEYQISFWYKNKGISADGLGAINGSAVWLQIFYNDPDDWHTQHGVPITYLNPSEEEWQYFSASYTTEAGYNKFKIYLNQEGDANELYITNLSLFKSVSSSGYDYDTKGNLKTVVGTNKEVSSFEYNKNNQLINSTNPKGKKLMYEYDNNVPDRLINSISEMGICSEIKYDINNNPVVTRVNKKGINGEITEGLYKIRAKGTNLYLRNIMNSIKLKEECSHHDLWKLEKIDEYYKISHSLVPDKYFTIYNDELLLTVFNGDNSLFTLIKNKNGSYSLAVKKDNKYVKVEDKNLIGEFFVDEDSSFEFFFETNNEKEFIETYTKYTEDGKFIKSVTDSNLNETTYDIDLITGITKSVTNAKNQTTNYEYDSKRRPISIKNGNREVEYNYNDNNLLSKITQETRDYNFIYDEFLNTKSIKIGDDISLITNNYEGGNGNLLTTIYGNNQTINFEYDEFDRVKTINKMDNTYNFKYGNNGDLLKVISNDDVYNYKYDLGKRLIEYRSNEFGIKYKYDINSNITDIEYDGPIFSKEVKKIYDEDDALTKMIFDSNEVNYAYDNLGRIESSNIDNKIKTNYEYVTNGRRTSTLVKKFTMNDAEFSYRFDKLNNITHIYHNGILENKYYYDEYNELISEDNYLTNQTVKYTYDNLGNILFKKIFELGTDNLIDQDIYEYNNLKWKDQLTKFNNQEITYDEIGNPLTIGDASLSWINGRKLNSYSDSNYIINYKYDNNGIRTSKVVNGLKTVYLLEGNKIIFENIGSAVIYYIHNDIDDLIGFKYNEKLYYYLKNNQDDIIGLLDSNYNLVAKYQYDSWGNIISIKNKDNNDIIDEKHVAHINPFRYRSYYYDKETKLYYLNSRYYNPKWGRFINADNVMIQNNSLTGNNLYAYVDNDPINKVDSSGRGAIWNWIKKTTKKVVKKVAKVVKKVVNAVKSVVNIGKKTATKVGSIINKNNYVASYGYGTGISNPKIPFSAYNDISTVETVNGTKQIVENCLSVTIGPFVLTHNYDHPYPFTTNDQHISINEIEQFNCPESKHSNSIAFSIKNIFSIEASNEEIFIGIDYDFHYFAGGHVKFGYNVPR